VFGFFKDGLGTLLGNLGSGLLDMFGGLGGFIKGAFGSLVDLLGGLIPNFIKDAFSGIASFIGDAIGGIGGVVGDVVGGVVEKAGEIAKTVGVTAKDILFKMIESGQKVTGAIRDFIEGLVKKVDPGKVFDIVKAGGSQVLDKLGVLGSTVGEGLIRVGTGFINIASAIASTITGALASGAAIVGSALAGFAGAALSAATAVGSAFSAGFASLAGGITGFLGTVARGIAGFFGFGFQEGGRISKGPKIVGEQGPEIFNPDSAGRVIPFKKLPMAAGRGRGIGSAGGLIAASGGGGGGIINNFQFVNAPGQPIVEAKRNVSGGQDLRFIFDNEVARVISERGNASQQFRSDRGLKQIVRKR